MADIFSKEGRSRVMSKVARKDTPKELVVRKFLFHNGFRYRKNYKKLPGSPDIAILKYKVVIFIHGCFWHGHSCKAGTLPKSNIEFWEKKIRGNVERDNSKEIQLQTLGWRVISLWQCEFKNKEAEYISLNRLLLLVNSLKANIVRPFK